MLTNNIILIGFIVVLLYLSFQRYLDNKNVSRITASDGHEYLVRQPHAIEAAELLATLRGILERVKTHIVLKDPDGPASSRLQRGFNNTIFAENSHRNITGYSAYTINKGHKMVYCLRNKNSRFVPLNTLVYVGLHELAHIMTEELDTNKRTHSKEFWTNFGHLLQAAQNIGLYIAHNYKQFPTEYCGETIT